MPGVEALAALMSEDNLDYHVRCMMNDLGLAPYSFHPYGPGRYRAGFPDWTIAGPRGLLFRELKRQSKSPTREQRAWLARLQALGLDAGVWQPVDLYSKRILRELAAIAEENALTESILRELAEPAKNVRKAC